MPQGFVIQDDETNDVYLASFSPEDPWLPIIQKTHKKLTRIDPDYRIVQIKSKFGGLRYYFSSSFSYGTNEYTLMSRVVDEAEQEIEALSRTGGADV